MLLPFAIIHCSELKIRSWIVPNGTIPHTKFRNKLFKNLKMGYADRHTFRQLGNVLRILPFPKKGEQDKHVFGAF
jgi:hypothetical protein